MTRGVSQSDQTPRTPFGPAEAKITMLIIIAFSMYKDFLLYYESDDCQQHGMICSFCQNEYLLIYDSQQHISLRIPAKM